MKGETVSIYLSMEAVEALRSMSERLGIAQGKLVESLILPDPKRAAELERAAFQHKVLVGKAAVLGMTIFTAVGALCGLVIVHFL